MNKTVTLPTGWYEKAVPEALSFLLLLAKVPGSMRFPLWAILVCTVGNVQFSTNEKKRKKDTNQHFLQSLVPGRQAA